MRYVSCHPFRMLQDSRFLDGIVDHTAEPAVLADQPDAVLNLLPEESNRPARSSAWSIFSFAEGSPPGGQDGRHSPYDIARYIDRVSMSMSPARDSDSYTGRFFFLPVRIEPARCSSHTRISSAL
jgi:hypothetical protein